MANDFSFTISSNYLSQHVLDPTFGANILDLVFTKEPSRITATNVGPPINSSNKGKLHATITWDLHLKDIPQKANKKTPIPNINKSDFTSMNTFFSNTNWATELAGLDCSSMYEKFIEIYNRAISRFTPFTQINTGQRPTKPKWLNKELVNLAHLKKQPMVQVCSSEQRKQGGHTEKLQRSLQVIQKKEEHCDPRLRKQSCAEFQKRSQITLLIC